MSTLDGAVAEFKSLEDHTWWLLRTLETGAAVFALTPVAGALWVLFALQRDRAAAVPDVIAIVRSEVSSAAFVMPAIALALVVWLWRAYRNLPALGVGSLPYARWWVVGAWLIPVVNLIRPWQIVVAVWNFSDPGAAGAHGGSTIAERPATADAWWGLWLLGAALVSASYVLDDGVGATTTDAVMIVLAQFAWGAGSAALIPVVRGVTARQAERALRLGLEPDAGGAGPDVVARSRSAP